MSLSNNSNITHNGRIRKEFFKSLELVYAHLRRVSITNHCYNAGIVTLELFQKDVDIKAGLLVQETHLQRGNLRSSNFITPTSTITFIPLMAVYLSPCLHHLFLPF